VIAWPGATPVPWTEAACGPRPVASLTLLVALGALAAAAAPARAEPPELTAFAGVRTGFEFEDGATGADRPADESPTLGLMLGFPLDNDRTSRWSGPISRSTSRPRTTAARMSGSASTP